MGCYAGSYTKRDAELEPHRQRRRCCTGVLLKNLLLLTLLRYEKARRAVQG